MIIFGCYRYVALMLMSDIIDNTTHKLFADRWNVRSWSKEAIHERSYYWIKRVRDSSKFTLFDVDLGHDMYTIIWYPSCNAISVLIIYKYIYKKISSLIWLCNAIEENRESHNIQYSCTWSSHNGCTRYVFWRIHY